MPASMLHRLCSPARSLRSTTCDPRPTTARVLQRTSCDDSGVTPLARDGMFAIRGRRVVTPAGMRSAAVHIDGRRIARITDWSDISPQTHVVDAGDDVVMAGVVDTHVHVNEPGRTEWEGFHSATRAAAAGGVTTILDMPLNSIPATTSTDAL